MRGQCETCNRQIEGHLAEQGKSLCFTCLLSEVTQSGSLPTFKIREKPVQAPCGVCSAITDGHDLQPSSWGFLCSQCRALCETQTGFNWRNLSITAQKEWLVRSIQRILGPYSTDEVVVLLQENKVVALDEVSAPFGRWHYIRDNENFRFVVNEIRNKRASATENKEQTISATETDVITSSLNPSAFGDPELLVREAQENQEREAQPIEEPQAPSRDLVKSFAVGGLGKTKSVKRKTRKKSQAALWLISALSLVFLGAVVFKQKSLSTGGSGGAKTRAFQDVMAEGLKAERMGDFEKAYDFFVEAQNLKPKDSEMLLHLAPMTLVFGRQVLQAQSMFKAILEAEQGSNYKKAAHMGLGLVALENREYDQAWENFMAAYKIDPELSAAAGNLGIVQFFKGKHSEAEALLYKTLDKGADGAFAIVLADIALALAEEKNDKSKYRAAHDMLSAYINYMNDYRQEALVMDARILTLMDRDTEVQERLEQFLDTDPELTDLHVHDWQVYRGRVSWDYLREAFKKATGNKSGSAHITAGQGLVMYKSREKIDGAQTLERALLQAPNDPLIMALAGWVQVKLGRRDQGLVNIRQAAKNPGKYRLPLILAARVCEEEKNFECSKAHWEALSKLSGNAVEGMVGMARYYLETKNFDQARVYLKQALAADPTFIPALVLAEELQTRTMEAGT